MTETTQPSFLAKVTAKLNGDGKAELAAKIAIKAESALKSEVSALNSNITDLGIAVTDAKGALSDAIVPKVAITSNKAYTAAITVAQNHLDGLNADLAEAIASRDYFQSLLDVNFPNS